ncbi:uncharacterized protein LOC127251199 [Andrographis paniculata]|uniref:uncharacterized protein LOC127251199 n=1 Tax=Andrographis paniculata TaxID=175694 RepID=UPI0021E80F55|nr:uncharacterized protein LOC127251199 [Andrographis paniculata]XP_051130751.1 uncharacterized protein LOC127251199 [Andrographis paniculata]
MASDMKGFYRQKKKSGISKSNSSKKSSKSKNSAAQPPALFAHGSLDLQDDYDANEEVLRQFDMNMAYGPCLGMSRLERLERAKTLGLHPPKEVENLLRATKVNAQCLWDGRV